MRLTSEKRGPQPLSQEGVDFRSETPCGTGFLIDLFREVSPANTFICMQRLKIDQTRWQIPNCQSSKADREKKVGGSGRKREAKRGAEETSNPFFIEVAAVLYSTATTFLTDIRFATLTVAKGQMSDCFKDMAILNSSGIFKGRVFSYAMAYPNLIF